MALVIAVATIVLAVRDVVELPRFTTLGMMGAIAACWLSSRIWMPDNPKSRWMPGAKMTVTLIVAGVVGCLVLLCAAGLVRYRAIDGCVSHMPHMGPFAIRPSANVITATVTCTFERDGHTQTVKLPFGEFL